MEIFKIGIVGIIVGLCVVNLREVKGDIAVLVSLVGGIVLLLFVLDYFTDIFSFFETIIKATGVDSEIIKILMKIVGVGYAAEFCASIADESGVKSIGDKIVLGGKVIILISSFPIIKLLLEIITGLLS